MAEAQDTDTRTITEYEVAEVQKANADGRQPVLFVHGLWLLPNSWQPWREVFEEAGYVTAAPGWPDDPETTEEAKDHPEVFANKSIGEIADHYEEVIRTLERKPAIIGHSFGGLLTEIRRLPDHRHRARRCRRPPRRARARRGRGSQDQAVSFERAAATMPARPSRCARTNGVRRLRRRERAGHGV